MKTLFRCLLRGGVSTLAILGSLTAHAGPPPEQILKDLWRDVRCLSQEADLSIREEKVKSLLRAHYDFEAFYETALQDHWGQWAEKQKKDFGDRFEGIFLDTLVRKLARIPQGDVALAVRSRQGGGDRVAVSMEGVKGAKRVGFQVYFVKRGDAWKIYDADIAGALLSRNYRGQFNRILRNDGFDSLIARLDQKKTSTGGNL